MKPTLAGRSIVTFSWLLLLAGCSGGSDGVTTPPVVEPPQVTLSNAVNLAEMVGDIRERIVPYMPEGAQREAVVAALVSLSASLDRGFVAPVETALTKVNLTIDAYAAVLTDETGAMADLDVLRLAMDFVAAQVAADSRSTP